MRITMMLTVLAPIGGIEAALVPLTLELKAQGHDVMIYTLLPVPEPNQYAAALRAAGIRILASSAWTSRLARAGAARRSRFAAQATAAARPALLPIALLDARRRRRTLGRSLQGAAGRWHAAVYRQLDFERLYFRRLGRAFQQRPPDVVHVHGWGCGEDPPGAMGWLSRQQLPVVYTEHSTPDPARDRPIEQAPMNLADVLIAASNAADSGLRRVGRASKPIVVIPCSVEPLPAVACNGHSEFTIVCVARLSRQKGQADLLDAMAHVVAQVPNARLLLAGEGPTRPQLEAQVVRLGLAGHVFFLGLVTRPELPAVLACADVFALPSLWEARPLAISEAMSAGKAIVASNVGGNPELVTPGLNGWLVPPGDVAALAEALLKLAADPEAVRRMGAASQARFAEGGSAPALVAAQHLEAYRRAIDSAIHRKLG